MSRYDNMLPAEPIKGKLGYYPVKTKEEWDELPAIYKAMDWFPAKDYRNKGELSAVKSVIFDVVYMTPYKISAKVSVHRQEIQKILFCSYGDTQCHLYSVGGVELESGTVLRAKWLQDTTTGAYSIVANGVTVAKQGGFGGYIPKGIEVTEDGGFKYNWNRAEGCIGHYEVSNPFR